MRPLKYRSVNWINGMKLSCEHFSQTDRYIEDLIRNAQSLSIHQNNFGLLPPLYGFNKSFDLDILEKTTNHLEVKIRYFNAITLEGCHIGITQNDSSEAVYLNQNFNDFEHGNYSIILKVNPFDKLPIGVPHAEESPLRFPDLEKKYIIEVINDNDLNDKGINFNYITIGKVIYQDKTINIDDGYIIPSSTVISHEKLIEFYNRLAILLNSIQKSSFKIIDKTSDLNKVSDIGKNLRQLSEKINLFIASIFYKYRNECVHQSPIKMIGYFSELAYLFFTGLKLVPTKEREELLKYFYEWKDVTPGNFEEILTKTIEVVYDNNQLKENMNCIFNFMTVLDALWNKLSELEYLGQHKENIIVSELTVEQKNPIKKTWSLLD